MPRHQPAQRRRAQRGQVAVDDHQRRRGGCGDLAGGLQWSASALPWQYAAQAGEFKIATGGSATQPLGWAAKLTARVAERFKLRQDVFLAELVLDSFCAGYGTARAARRCTVAYLLQPELFATKACNVSVETESELTLGHTAVDFWHVTDRPLNCSWAYEINADGFFELLTDRLARFADLI